MGLGRDARRDAHSRCCSRSGSPSAATSRATRSSPAASSRSRCSVAIFTFFPVVTILGPARSQDGDGALSLTRVLSAAVHREDLGLGCLAGGTRCGVAWNTLLLALLCAVGCTALGLAFALIVTRTGFRYKRVLRVAVGAADHHAAVRDRARPDPALRPLGPRQPVPRMGVRHRARRAGSTACRACCVAQVFAFTPIAFLVLIGVVEGVSPRMEEAAQTLRADRWRTFVDVSLPLMRPGLANAFLISFIESIADFGNPIVLGGNFGVLSTEVFFSVVGAQLDQGRAATLGIVLLLFALAAFFAAAPRARPQGLHGAVRQGRCRAADAAARRRAARSAMRVALPWVVLTVVIYAMALAGGFVETWGRDYTPTLQALRQGVRHRMGHRTASSGRAPPGTRSGRRSKLSAIAAPITAALGILAAYLLTRQRFAGQSAFEFGTMLSFAIPGTVIGVSYILAFNVPPIEITGTALILIVCNVFRNMPVGVRAGMASMAQIDRSLDEASTTLGARGFDDAAHDAAAAAEAGGRRRARLQLRPRDDDRVGRDLPRLGRIRMGDDVHHQPRRERRLRRRDRLQLGADRADAGGDLAHPDAGRRAHGSAAPRDRAQTPAWPNSARQLRERRSHAPSVPAAMKAASIEFRDVSKRYGDVAAVQRHLVHHRRRHAGHAARALRAAARRRRCA